MSRAGSNPMEYSKVSRPNFANINQFKVMSDEINLSKPSRIPSKIARELILNLYSVGSSNEQTMIDSTG